jgi:hypothetical protein
VYVECGWSMDDTNYASPFVMLHLGSTFSLVEILANAVQAS